MAIGEYDKPSRWRKAARMSRRRLIEMVDAGSLMVHLLTVEAAAAGQAPQGRYVALCGAPVVPAAMVDPGRSSCRPCWGVAA